MENLQEQELPLQLCIIVVSKKRSSQILVTGKQQKTTGPKTRTGSGSGVVVRWIPTDQNWADIFTKPLAAEKIYKFWKQMCGYEPWQVPDGTTTAAGATKFEFTQWRSDTVCYRHCKEWGGERTDPTTPPHSPKGGAHAVVCS
jgi:hypothetical protein